MALGLDEAMLLEQQATLAARERKKQEEERRQRKGLPIKGEILTQQQREAKIWAFMYVISCSIGEVSGYLTNPQECKTDRIR